MNYLVIDTFYSFYRFYIRLKSTLYRKNALQSMHYTQDVAQIVSKQAKQWRRTPPFCKHLFVVYMFSISMLQARVLVQKLV